MSVNPLMGNDPPMGKHSRPPSRGGAVAVLSAVLGAAVLLPVAQDMGAGGLTAAHAAPVDPTTTRRPTPTGKPSPTATTTAPDPSPTTSSDPPDTSTATSTASASASDSPTSDPTGSGVSGGSGGSGGSTDGPSVQSVQTPSVTAEPPTTARATTPITAATPTVRGGNSGGNSGGPNGSGSSATAVAVEGRKVAAPTGDGRSSREVDVGLAAGTLTADGSPTSEDSSAPSSSGSTEASDVSGSDGAGAGSDQAELPSDEAVPVSWRVAAVVALAIGGLAVALLIAAGRPRSGSHRRH